MGTTFQEITDYVKFVGEIVSKYREIGDLVRDEDINLFDVQLAQARYYNTSLGILAEYQRYKREYKTADREFRKWYDTIFEEAKREVISEYSNNKSIKPSLKEFENRARIKNKDMYYDWEKKISDKEDKMRFSLRLLDIIKSYGPQLSSLSYSLSTELSSMNVEKQNVREKFGKRIPV